MQLDDKNGRIILVDDDTPSHILSRGWYSYGNRNMWYARHAHDYLHRIVLAAPPGTLVDHINGNGLDNRKCNLRFATHQVNRVNCTRAKATGLPIGVTLKKKRARIYFRAGARVNGKQMYLGQYKTAEEAGRVYDAFVLDFYGPSALTNYPLLPRVGGPCVPAGPGYSHANRRGP